MANSDDDKIREALQKFRQEKAAGSGGLPGVSQPWSNPSHDVMNDIRVVAIKTGFANPNYSPHQINQHPQLKTCSKCWTERTEVRDPWGFTKICPKCGYVDEVTSVQSATLPETITWPEVQKMIIGILRQVEGQKVQVHPDEFSTDGVTLFQRTDPITRVVTIWFEKVD